MDIDKIDHIQNLVDRSREMEEWRADLGLFLTRYPKIKDLYVKFYGKGENWSPEDEKYYFQLANEWGPHAIKMLDLWASALSQERINRSKFIYDDRIMVPPMWFNAELGKWVNVDIYVKIYSNKQIND